MSQLSEQIRKAVYAKFADDTALKALAVGGIHWLVAPVDAANSLIVLGRIPVSVNYAFAGNLTYEEDLFPIKAIVGSDFSKTKSAPALCEEILTRIDELVEEGVAISGKKLYFRRESEMVSYQEKRTDQSFYHHGANYRAVISNE